MKFFSALLMMLLPSISFAQSAVIYSPTEGSDMSARRSLQVNFEVRRQLYASDRFVVFRANNGNWNRVHEVKPRFLDISTARRVQNLNPDYYFCYDTYAIRLMRGRDTLAGPVHFRAGAGACAGDSSVFVNLENNQSDIRRFEGANQLNRDTCGSFGGVAALEAAYKRLKGIDVRLSTHYMHHIIKSSWLNDVPFYRYENQSSYWGGNDPITALKFLQFYPLPIERFSSYKSQDELTQILRTLGLPQLRWSGDPRRNFTTQDQIDRFEYSSLNISQRARANARYGVDSYSSHRAGDPRNVQRIENYLRNGEEVLFAVSLDWRDHPNQAKTKIYDSTANGGAHIMLIVGFDRTGAEPYFLVKNSWGDGILRMHYDVFRRSGGTIAVIRSVKDPNLHNASFWLGRWDMRHDRWDGTLTLRRNVEASLDASVSISRIGEYQSSNGNKHCVWGSTSNSSKKLKMWIDFDSTIQVRERRVRFGNSVIRAFARNVCPKEKRGQYFEVDVNSRTALSGRGTTWWNGNPFPVSIRR